MGRGQGMELRAEDRVATPRRRRTTASGDWLVEHPLLREHPAIAAEDRSQLGDAWRDSSRPSGAWWAGRPRWALPRASGWEASVWVADAHAPEPFRAFVAHEDGGATATARGASVEQAIWLAMSRRKPGAGSRMPSIAELRTARDEHFTEEQLHRYRARPHAEDLGGALFGSRRPTI